MSSITAKGNLSGATLTVSRSASISGALLTKGDITGKANITALGILSGANLTVSRSASISGTLLTKGNITGKGNITALGILSGTTLRVSGPADIHGPLAVTGSIRTDGNLTLNDIAAAVDAVLTFGNASGNQTLKYLNASQKFQFSKGISVLGTISGSALNVDRNATIGGSLTASGAIRTKSSISGATLTVDGNVTLHGQTYNFPTSQTSNGFLKTDGAGNLTWSATASIGNGSGEIISLHPEYPNAIYFSSGASFVGQLTASGGVAGLVQNFYRWTSSKAASQNYWIAVRVRLPDNFSSWDPVKPIELLYRTADGTAANNHVSVRMRDTAGALVALSNNVDLTNAGTFTTAKITGPEVGGPTWAPKGYITIYIKMAATTGKYADVGYLNLNFENTNP
jgi:Fe2+ transport system protein FeoA